MKPERRYIEATEIRVVRSDRAGIKISGYAAKFNKYSEDLGGFREKIKPGAFTNALKSSDVRALFNHNPDKIIGRTGVNLQLKEDNKGLYMEVDAVDTPTFNSVVADIEAGLVTQQSFGFTIAADSWRTSKEFGEVRTIEEIGTLFDVSPVTYPAYPDTTVALESRSLWKKEQEEKPAFEFITVNDGDETIFSFESLEQFDWVAQKIEELRAKPESKPHDELLPTDADDEEPEVRDEPKPIAELPAVEDKTTILLKKAAILIA